MYTRRHVLMTAGIGLALASTRMLTAAEVLAASVQQGVVMDWNDGGVSVYQFSPERPLKDGHIRWPEHVNKAFLDAMARGDYAEETIRDGDTWDGMYFGADDVRTGRIIARPSAWDSDRSRRVRNYIYTDKDLAAIYSVPEVCGNPSWKILRGTQPLCVPRPERNHLYEPYYDRLKREGRLI